MGNAEQRPAGRGARQVGAGSVRIIGGAWRGRRLRIPAGTSVRPTPDRVRETLFNWLHGRVAGRLCIDLFAGSGCLGFEALSRGAREAWFVERDRKLAAALRDHAALLGANATIVEAHAKGALHHAAPRFDLAFVDPPYSEAVEPWLATLMPHLAPRALVYVERRWPEGLPDNLPVPWLKRSRAGGVEFGLLAMAEADDGADGPPGLDGG